MLISYSHKFIFVHVYKSAGTSIREVLTPYSHRPILIKVLRKLRLSFRFFPYYYRYENFDEHIKAAKIKENLPPPIYNDFFKFAFVRNPWDWQVSLYHYILQYEKHHQHTLIKSLPSFEAYIEWRVHKDKKLQKSFITDSEGNIIVDFIGRFETLTDDFKHVCQQLNLDNLVLPRRNKSSHDKYRSYYTPYTQQLIAEHFDEDIKLFGYSF